MTCSDYPDRSEFSWGAGLDPPGTEDLPPNEGGRYRGSSPPCDFMTGILRHPR